MKGRTDIVSYPQLMVGAGEGSQQPWEEPRTALFCLDEEVAPLPN